jgi:general secretion pathway protein G
LNYRRGFTLLELMVVLLILALLASIAAPQVTKHLRKAKVETAKIQVEALGAAVDSFNIDTGRFPTTEESLKALVEKPAGLDSWDGPYIKKKDSLIDPWGEPYHYQHPGSGREYDIFSLGSDRKEGGEGDAGDVGKG